MAVKDSLQALLWGVEFIFDLIFGLLLDIPNRLFCNNTKDAFCVQSVNI